MKSLLKKARENKKGFTLAELLVVVAIVGILVAISIPVFTAQLGKARRATNQANLRAAKAAAVAEYLTDDSHNNGTGNDTLYYKYNISAGSVEAPVTSFTKDGYTEFTDGIDTNTVSNKDVYKTIYVAISAKTSDKDIENESVVLYAKAADSSSTTTPSESK